MEILKHHLKKPAGKSNLGLTWVFKTDNDPKCVNKLASMWLSNNKVNVL